MWLACSCQASEEAASRTATVQCLPIGAAGLEAECYRHVKSTFISQGLGSMRKALRTTVKYQHAHLFTAQCKDDAYVYMTCTFSSSRQTRGCAEIGFTCFGKEGLVSFSTVGAALFVE